VAVGFTVTTVPLITAPTPLLIAPVPPEKTPVKLVELPAVMVVAAAVKLLITGGATPPTVRVAVPLTPLSDAVIMTVPLVTPVATPPLTVATEFLEELQFADAVMSFIVPSLYVAVAVNDVLWLTTVVAVGGETMIDFSTAIPLPVSAAVCGEPTALSLICSWPLRVPAAVGENLTVTGQPMPEASVAGQLLVSEKSPVAWIDVIDSATGCTFVTWIVLPELVVPMFWEPNDCEEGESVTGLIPVPLRLAVVGDPIALCATERVPEIGPREVGEDGEKVTKIGQVPPAGRVFGGIGHVFVWLKLVLVVTK